MTDALQVPEDQEFLDQFGEAPSELDEPWVRKLTVETENGELALSYDENEQSIRFIWTQNGRVLWDFFRESALSLAIRSERGETHFVAEFDPGELSGELDVRVYPAIAIKDFLMR